MCRAFALALLFAPAVCASTPGNTATIQTRRLQTATQCVDGQYNDQANGCTDCDAGTFVNCADHGDCLVGQGGSPDTCDTCAAGSITNTLEQSGGTTCTACGPGQATAASTVACADCIAGEYSTAGMASCTACNGGSITDTLDQPAGTTCTACDAGRYSTASTVACTACAAGSATDTLGQTVVML